MPSKAPRPRDRSPRRQSYIVPPQANRELTDDGRAPRRRAGPDRDNVSPRGFRLRSAGSGNRYAGQASARPRPLAPSTIQRSEEHTSELQSLMRNSYAVFFLNKKI